VLHFVIHYFDALVLTAQVLLKISLSFAPVLPMLGILAVTYRFIPKRWG
jgi:hypothetical protein